MLKSLLSIFALLLFACGCAGAHQDKLTLAPVGSGLEVAVSSSSNGVLEVYSALQAGYYHDKYGDMYEDIVQQYSGYKICRPDGIVVCSVDNNGDNGILAPELVRLPPGRYCVDARARGYDRVFVPVIIKGGELTVVHLEGGNMWPDKSAFTGANSVRLPDGKIVGWKAQETSPL